MNSLIITVIKKTACIFSFCLLAITIHAQKPTPTPDEGIRICTNPESGETIARKTTSSAGRDNFFKCTYKTIVGAPGSNHEPPIGAGGGSMFFDIPHNYVTLVKLGGKTEVYGKKYYRYQIVKTSNPTQIYKALADVLVMTEEIKGPVEGEISLWDYSFNRTQNARLKLWLTKDGKASYSNEPDIVVNGSEDGGLILSRKKIKHKNAGKQWRKNRFVRSKKNLRRVIKWQGVSMEEAHEEELEGYGAEGDDLYYFYIRFYHPIIQHP